VTENGNQTTVSLERIGRMPMPIDLLVEYTDGTMESFMCLLRMMNYEKANPNPAVKRTVLNDWTWAHSNYDFTIAKAKGLSKKITH
jgi:hypothetical protein